MSLGRLLIASRDLLRGTLSSWRIPFLPEEIMVMPGPEPPAYSGEHFISLHGTRWAAGQDPDQNRGLDEVYSFAATVTFRSPHIPYDRQGDEVYVKAYTGMEDLCRKIIVTIHQSTVLQVAWDALITSETRRVTDDGLPIDLSTEYPRWQDCDPAPIPVDGTWFSAEPMSAAGLVMGVRFYDARRMQAYDRME